MVPAIFPADLDSLPKLVSACHAHPGGLFMIYALGLHPYALAAHPPAEDDAHLDRLERTVWASTDPRLRAIGECGLHFIPKDGHQIDRARQILVTRRQLDLARRSGLPAILHCVRAHEPLFDLLDERATPPCVLHSFSGSAELAREYTRRGHFVSFAGSLTGPRAGKIAAAARVVPDERLLIETDSPDQTPSELRPAVNEPANVRLVAEALARTRGQELPTLAQLTFDNACRVFGVEAACP